MIDVTKASRETKDEYILASEAFEEINDLADTAQPSERFEKARAKLRAECAPKLRSREQVDADIVTVIRRFWSAYAPRKGDRLDWDSLGSYSESIEDLNRLCAEPTAEEPAGKTLTLTTDIEALAKSLRETLNPTELVMLSDLIDPTAGKEPAELDLAEHEVCSCEEAEELKRRLSQANGRLKLWRGIAQAREEMYDKLKTAIEALDQ